MGLKEEIGSFISQTHSKYRAVGLDFKGTFLEKDFERNLASVYLQCKYISERLNRSIILRKEVPEKSILLAFRRGELFKKLFLKAIPHLKNNENPKFIFEDYRTDILTEEYVDLILMVLSSLFEFYTWLLRNQVLFNCTELAKGLDNAELVANLDKINKTDNLEKLYAELSKRTNTEYGCSTGSLFSMKAYQVRCASFHMSYSYRKEGDSDFKILLNGEGSNEILYTDLIKLTIDILAKINVTMIVPHYFSINKLPLKGY